MPGIGRGSKGEHRPSKTPCSARKIAPTPTRIAAPPPGRPKAAQPPWGAASAQSARSVGVLPFRRRAAPRRRSPLGGSKRAKRAQRGGPLLFVYTPLPNVYPVFIPCSVTCRCPDWSPGLPGAHPPLPRRPVVRREPCSREEKRGCHLYRRLRRHGRADCRPAALLRSPVYRRAVMNWLYWVSGLTAALLFVYPVSYTHLTLPTKA